LKIQPSPLNGALDPWLLSTAFEQSTEGFALVTTDGQVAQANPALTRLVGGPVTGWESFPAMIHERALLLPEAEASSGADADQPWESIGRSPEPTAGVG
jgi:PAS domain-containing protein